MPFPRPAVSPVVAFGRRLVAFTAALSLAGSGVVVVVSPGHAQVPDALPPLPLPAPAAPRAPGPRPFDTGVPDTVRLQFANTDVVDVLENYYAPLTGKRMVIDNTLQGKLTVSINTPVPREEAIRILENNLMLNGVSLVQGEGNIVKAINPTKNARFYGPPIFSELAQLPEGDQVVSFLLKPRYLDVQELQAALSQYIQVQKQFTSFLALPKAGALLVTEESPTVRRIVGFVEQIDLPPATVIDRFIKLERADAAKAVEFVNTVLGKETKGGQTAAAPGVPTAPGGGARRPIRRVNEEGQPILEPPIAGLPQVPGLGAAIAALSEGALTAGSVSLQADVRTNRVHVVARPADFPFIERLIREFDANTPFAEPTKRPLKYLTATDALPILGQALSEPGTDGGQGQNAGASGTNPATGGAGRNNASTGLNRGGSGSLFGSNNGSSLGGGDSSNFGSSGSGTLGTSSLQPREVSERPESIVVGTTRLIADPRANAIIILGGAEAREKVARILDQLDVPAPQVMIEVLIGELTLSNSQEFGLDYLVRSGNSHDGFVGLSTNNARASFSGGTTTTTTDPTTGAPTTGNNNTLATAANLAANAATSLSGFGGLAGIVSLGNNFALAVRALETAGRFKTISRPVIFTSNNKPATIVSGQQIAIPTQTIQNAGTTVNSAAIASSVQYKEVALQLEVVPLINSDNAVTLDIVQQVNNVLPNSGTSVGGTTVPAISTRQIKSTVTVPNNGTIVLGGLVRQSETRNLGRVPLLSRIPLVGELFKSRTKDDTRDELIILLRPVITNTNAQLVRNRADEEKRLYLEPGLDEQLRPIPKAVPVETTTTTTVIQQRRRQTTPAVYTK